MTWLLWLDIIDNIPISPLACGLMVLAGAWGIGRGMWR